MYCEVAHLLSVLLDKSEDGEDFAELPEALLSVGDTLASSVSTAGTKLGTALAIDSGKGSIGLFSLIEKTIFSNPNDVRCFSRPLLVESWSIVSLGLDGFLISRGSVCMRFRHCINSAPFDCTESTLLDSSGISRFFGRGLSVSLAGEDGNCGCESQQNVSRFHILQLIFSNLRPSSIDSAHFEKTCHESVCRSVDEHHYRQNAPVHMPCRFSIFLVSILCIFPASIVTTGAAILDGMLEICVRQC